MIYGNKFLPKETKITENSISVIYDEYTNRLSLLESCTNEEERSILEAQVQVLYEVSIKDITDKIISFFKWVFNKIKEFIGKLKDFVSKLFTKEKKTNASNVTALFNKLKSKLNIKITKNIQEDTVIKDTSQLFSDIANDPILYFDYNDIISDPNALYNNTKIYIDQLKKYEEDNFGIGGEDLPQIVDQVNKESMKDYTKSVGINDNFRENYFKGSNGPDDAFKKYLYNKVKNNHLDTADKVMARLNEIVNNNEKYCDILRKSQEQLISLESKTMSIIEKYRNMNITAAPDEKDKMAEQKASFNTIADWFTVVSKMLKIGITAFGATITYLGRSSEFADRSFRSIGINLNKHTKIESIY